MPRVAQAQQSVYIQSIIDKTLELFGDTSVEYGMALCGALQLGSQIQCYIKSYTAKELLEAIKVEEGNDEGADIIEDAQFQVEVLDLRAMITNCLGPNPRPAPWFTPSKD